MYFLFLPDMLFKGGDGIHVCMCGDWGIALAVGPYIPQSPAMTFKSVSSHPRAGQADWDTWSQPRLCSCLCVPRTGVTSHSTVPVLFGWFLNWIQGSNMALHARKANMLLASHLLSPVAYFKTGQVWGGHASSFAPPCL